MLEGLLVADFSRVLAGPYATMLLGDLGADVVKVERGGRDGIGDDTRSWGPPWRGEDSTYFLGLNRNKRSVALDLENADDRALARTLCLQADVMVENFRPGLMASWGLDGDTLRAGGNPQLVSCSVTAFGAENDLPGYDFLAQAVGGLMHVTGEADGRPLKVGAAVVDLVCGLLSAVGILAALRGGGGRHVETSLMDAALASLLNQGSAWVLGGSSPGRMGNRHPSIVPYETFATADRPIAIAVGNDRLFARLWEAVGLEADPRYATSAARVEHREELVTQLGAVLRARPADAWVTLLAERGVPVGPVNDVPEAWALAERLGLAPLTDGFPAPPLRVDGERPPITRLPPALDEHGDEIRAWLRSDARPR